MIFARIKPEYDQKRRVDGSIYIKNELLTLKQVEKLRTPEKYFTLEDISLRNTYWCFGARFQGGR